MEDQFDLTICIYAPKKVQKERLIQRDKIEELLAEKMILAQKDIEEKKNLADIFIDNSKDKKEFYKNLESFSDKVFNSL